MKKITLILAAMLLCAGVSAQSGDSKNIDRYKQLLKLNHKSFEACSTKVASWGFTINKANTLDMFTMQMIPFVSNNANDSTGFTLSVLEEKKVIGMGLTVAGYDAVSMFARAQKFSEAQGKICEEQGLTNYVCAVKGNFKAKMPKSHAELMELLKTLDPADVKQVLEMWKSEDKKVAATFLYENKRYGKKKPKEKDAIEISISQTDSRED